MRANVAACLAAAPRTLSFARLASPNRSGNPRPRLRQIRASRADGRVRAVVANAVKAAAPHEVAAMADNAAKVAAPAAADSAEVADLACAAPSNP
jgi:hypothetical protein